MHTICAQSHIILTANTTYININQQIGFMAHFLYISY